MKKSKKKRKIILSILLVVFIIGIGISLAWLRTVLLGEKELSVVVGKIDLILDDSFTEGITLVNAFPTYDDEGKTQEPYIFTLENNSSISLDYTISIVTDEEAMSNCATTDGNACEQLDYRDIRYELKRNTEIETGTLSDSAIIDYGTISPGQENTYQLKIWLNIDANNNAQGKVLLGKLKVFSSQTLINSNQGTEKLNAPVMNNNMIAVKYNGYNWVKTDEENGWYNYERQMWANAVTVKSETLASYQSAAINTVIPMEDIETMWVWIPRYSYTIASMDGGNYYGKKGMYLDSTPTKALPGEIDIKFISSEEKDTGTAKYLASNSPSNYRTPDAFTFGDSELDGIWVGKFETSSSNPFASYGGGNTTSLDLMIKPNVTSWRGINVSNIYTVGLKVSSNGNRYGFSESMNSHAMKSSEWASSLLNPKSLWEIRK